MYVFMMFAPSSSKLSRVVPPVQQYKRAPAPGSSQDPVSLRSRLRNDSNTVPVSVSILHLFKSTLQVLYIYIRRMSSEYLRALQTSFYGVGLSPRQYTVWNVEGRARSTGGLSPSRGCCL